MWEDWKAAGATVIAVLGISAGIRHVSQWLIQRELKRYESMDTRLSALEDTRVTQHQLTTALSDVKRELALANLGRSKMYARMEAQTKQQHRLEVKLERLITLEEERSRDRRE